MAVLLRKSTSLDRYELTVAGSALLIVAAYFSGACSLLFPAPPKPPIILAAERGDVRALAAQLDKGVNPDTQDSILQTALMIAAEQDDQEAVRLLLDRHASVDLESPITLMTPLMYAASRGHTEVVQQLLESGADVNHANHLGDTALSKAVRSESVMRLLLERGADPNHADLAGRTALMRAAVSDVTHPGTRAAVVRILLEHGANVHALDKQGHDALFYAPPYDCLSEVVELLKSAGATGPARGC